MRFAYLASGSRGNASLIEAGDCRLLVDCGLSVKELERRMARLELTPECLDAVLVTHEHSDHLHGVPALSRKYGLPMWMTAGTRSAGRCDDLKGLSLFHCHGEGFRVGELEVFPYAVPHDAREPSQFVFRHADNALGMLTDSGCITPHILDCLSDCDALILECNHDRKMLADGPYPPALQRRVGGTYGHLCNEQAADLLGHLDHANLRWLVAAHLSAKNNHPEKAREALLAVSAELEERLILASQDGGTGWLEV